MRRWSLDRAALKSAARAAIVMPAVFAFADIVIGQPQTTIFAAFGSFAILVFAEFTGPPRTRLAAYLGLAAAGAVLIPIGTLCSQGALPAAAAMAVAGFVILFSGVVNGYFAAGGYAAILSLTLSANLRAPVAQIPERLAGWALACGVGISAVMLLWPSRPQAALRASAARACAALADALESQLTQSAAVIGERASAAQDAVAALRRSYLATPYRPTGSTRSTEAMAFLVDGLDWLLSLALPSPLEGAGATAICRDENRAVIAAAAAVLRATATTLDGGEEEPDLDDLERARDAVSEALVRDAAALPTAPTDAALLAALEPSFRLRELSYAAGEIGKRAASVTSRRSQALRGGRASAGAAAQVAAAYASLRSIWFRNSVRGAAALAVATYVAQRVGVQHAFWVVLGTSSVLRSSALATGSTVISALAGTAGGIVVGVALILAIGTDEIVLWAVFPIAILVAAYAPRAISFAAGQAGFTVVVLVLFNLISPSGWTVGLVRVEDVALGFAISLGTGALLWPRGAAAVVRRSLGEALARDAEYVAGAVRALERAPADVAVQDTRRAASGAGHRLDDVFRQLLAERGVTGLDLDSIGALVAGAARMGLAAESLLAVRSELDGVRHRSPCVGALDGEVAAFRSWYVALGDAVERGAPAPPPHTADGAGHRAVLRCVHEAVADGDQSRVRATLGLLLASRHLENLRRLEPRLLEPAARLAS